MTGKFSGRPTFQYIGRGRVKLLEDFTYYPNKRYEYAPVNVPKGFVSDLMSVPFFVRPFIHKFGDTMYGAIPHDYIYSVQDRTRAEADHIFLLALNDAGELPFHKIPFWKRRASYRGVRLGGWVSWNKIARELLKKKTD